MRARRKAAAVAAIVLVVVIVLAATLARFVSLDSLKPRIVAALEEKTGRTVAFSGISLALFPGIGVKVAGLSVSGDAGHPGESLLSVPEAEIRLAIAPLLAGRAEFTRLILHRPVLLLRRYRDGTHSATGIVERFSGAEAPAPSSPRKADVSVVLRAVSVEEAKLLLLLHGEDGRETRWEIGPLTFRVSGIGATRQDLSIETRVAGALRGEISLSGSAVRDDAGPSGAAGYRLSAAGKLFEQTVAVEGKLSPQRSPAEVELTVTFPGVALAKIPGIFAEPPAMLAQASPEGSAPLTVRVSGSPETMSFAAEADLTRASWKVGLGIRKTIGAPCSVTARGRRVPDRLLLSHAELKAPPLLVTASGSLAPSTGEREWAATARVASLADLPGAREGELSRFAPAGRLEARATGKRATAKAGEAWTVGVELGGVGFRLPDRKLDLRSLSGHVELTASAVDLLPLEGTINGQRFTLRGRVTRGPVPAGELSLRIPYLDADALFPPEDGGTAAKKAGGAAPAGTEREEQAISARADIRIDAGKARGLTFRDLSGKGRYERGNLFLDSVRARLYGGDASVSGWVGLSSRDRDFRVTVALKEVSAGEILSRKTALKDFLTGAASLSAEVGGSAKDFAEFSRTAAGSGSFRVTGGKIRKVDLLDIAARLSGLGSALRETPASRGAPMTGETPFSEIAADFRIGEGKIQTDALRIVSGKLDLAGAAVLGFDKTLAFRGRLRLPREASERVGRAAGRYLTDSSGRVEIPLTLSGPVTSPTAAIDTEELAKGAGRKGLDRLIDKLLPKRK